MIEWKYETKEPSIRCYDNISDYHDSEEWKWMNRISTTDTIYNSGGIFYIKIGREEDV